MSVETTGIDYTLADHVARVTIDRPAVRNAIDPTAEAEFQLTQMEDMLRSALIKCDIDPGAMDCGEPVTTGKQLKQTVVLRHGLDSTQARAIVKQIKDAKLKVQAQIQGDQVRVTGKKRDDLQQAIALLRQADIGVPLQYTNFRD